MHRITYAIYNDEMTVLVVYNPAYSEDNCWESAITWKRAAQAPIVVSMSQSCGDRLHTMWSRFSLHIDRIDRVG